ncbi:MAG: glycosyltransferase family 87 protein [Terracidiphilus sp.]
MRPVNAKARRDGLYLLLLGGTAFILLGGALGYTYPVTMVDFRVLYQPARCLLRHADPYNENEVLRISQAERGSRPPDTEKVRQVVTQYIYPPTTFSFTVPFAMFPWGIARLLWLMLTVGSLLFASFLIWSLGAGYAPVLSGALVGFLLANSELLVITGNVAGIAISLCVVAVWCFVRERFVPWGILCLAVGLAVKPHDTGLVWLYFLLAGGVYRKRAWQTLLAMVVFCLPAVLWVWYVSPNWIQELQTNVAAFSVRGGMNDPGLNSTGAHGLGMLVSLQALFGIVWDAPRIYNPASYLAFAPPFFAWLFVTLRSPQSKARTWLAIAAIAALSMLPVYHRQQDTKLLLLTVPACAMLWSEGGLTAWLALLVNSAGFVLAGDIPWAIFFGLVSKLHPSTSGFGGKVLIGMQVLPVPLILLILGIFYLCVYMRRSDAHASSNAQ